MRNNKPSGEETRAAELSITALAIFVALSIAIIALLVVRFDFELGYNAVTVASGALIFGVSLFLIAIEFFILSIFHQSHISYFGFIGSSLYGIGSVSMIIGISLTLKAFKMDVFAYLFLTWLLIWYILYYVVRIIRLGVETPRNYRIVVRVIFFLLFIVGYLILSTVGG